MGCPLKRTEGKACAIVPDARVITLPDIEEWAEFPNSPKPDEIDWEKLYKKSGNV